MKQSKTEKAKDKGVNVMPAIELVEYERVAYVKEMEDYLLELKNMSGKDAKRISKDNLVRSQIIQENGEFSDRYKYSRMNAHKRR